MRNGQKIKDGWTGEELIVKAMGRCLSCGLMTFGYEGNEAPDWRGMTGNRTYCPLVAEEYDMQGPDAALCAICANEHPAYKYGLMRAKTEKWGKVA